MLKARYINTFKGHDKFPVPNVFYPKTTLKKMQVYLHQRSAGQPNRVSSKLRSNSLFDVKVRAKANAVAVAVRIAAVTAESQTVRAVAVTAAPAIITAARAAAL